MKNWDDDEIAKRMAYLFAMLVIICLGALAVALTWRLFNAIIEG